MPFKPVLPQDQYADISFPLGGVDLSLGFGGQRPGTTRVGVNVRANEPLAQSSRGGARPGLDRYINDQTGGSHLIQHLNYVVDPQATAMPWYDPPFPNPADLDGPGIAGGPNYFTDSLFYTDPDGNVIRNGGTGVRYRKKRKPTPVTLVQSKSTFTQTNSAATCSLDSAVAVGHAVLAVVYYAGMVNGTGPPSISVADSLGNTYTQVATTLNRTILQGGVHSDVGMALFYTISLGGALAFTATVNKAAGYQVNLFEYKRVKATGALDGSSTNSVAFGSGGPQTVTTGSVSVSAVGDLLFGAFLFTADSVGLITSADGSTNLVDDSGFGVGGAGFANGHTQGRLASSSSASTGDWGDTVVDASNVDAYLAIGASFKKA